MSTRSEERFRFRDLARQQARINRRVRLGSLCRLAPLTEDDADTELSVDIAFATDAEGEVLVSGWIEGTLRLACHGCAEVLAHRFRLALDVCVVDAERPVRELPTGRDVLEAEADELTLAALIEDEILLSLPERLCSEEPCEFAPVLWYPAADAGAPERAEEMVRDSPFAALAEWKTSGTDARDED